LHRCFLGAKLHRMVITEADLDYVGSITIDSDLLDISGILPGEKVLVADLESGRRFETYVLSGERGSGTICINGAAARLVRPGDRAIILQFVWVGSGEVPPEPRVVVADDENLNPRLLHT
jgi:aspartate 1-decarboxylase